MRTKDVKESEFEDYYGRYLRKVCVDTPLREGFSVGRDSVLAFFKAIPEEQWNHKYDKDKWSIKEVLQHIIDTERIFAYRTFRIGRRDLTPLAPFDQNGYMEPSDAAGKTPSELLKEYIAVRESTLALINSLSDDDLCAIGTSSDKPMSARAAAFTILGHEIWHVDLINELYL